MVLARRQGLAAQGTERLEQVLEALVSPVDQGSRGGAAKGCVGYLRYMLGLELFGLAALEAPEADVRI